MGLLARHFWRLLGGQDAFPEDFVQRLESYDWPGNVRELHNTVLRRVALGEFAEAPVRKDTAPAAPAEAAPEGAVHDGIETILARDLPFPCARDAVVAEFERRYVERVLSRYDGNVLRAAAASGIARRYFQIIQRRHDKPDRSK